ncbi:DUF1073 domain-containing protein, partial [Klebsiella pneumoniae]|nr:DUF1073 domain-containing protein [Klebsiella pneumoniae]
GFPPGAARPGNYYHAGGEIPGTDFRPHIRLLFDVLHRSEFGDPLPEDFTFEFNPLWQMSDTHRSPVAANTAPPPGHRGAALGVAPGG